jgi:putative selenate reductase
VPVTVCSDLLKPGGYGRAAAYLAELARRMGEVRAHDVADFLVRAHGHGLDALGDLALAAEDPRRAACLAALEGGEPLEAAAGPELHRRWVAAAVLRNTARYAREVAESPRYRREANAKTPRKIGSRLELFDCITCDKCVPVCPNDANFTFELPPRSVPVVKLSGREGSWTKHVEGELAVLERHQIANFADFCNDCGNCDVFCPEDGGPYLVKPRFFGSIEDWRGTDLDGFCHESGADGAWVLHARIGGRELALGAADGGGRLCFSGQGFALRLDPESPADDPRGTADVEVDLTWFHVLCWIRSGVYGAGAPTSYPALLASGRE